MCAAAYGVAFIFEYGGQTTTNRRFIINDHDWIHATPAGKDNKADGIVG
ncbi:MAG: hypothetical protein ACO4B0_13515 [bacterium]